MVSELLGNAADYFEPIPGAADGYRRHPAKIITAMKSMGGACGAVGQRIAVAREMTGHFGASVEYKGTPERIAKMSESAVSGSVTMCASRRSQSKRGNGVGLDVGQFSKTRSVQAASVADAYTADVVRTVRERLDAGQMAELAAYVEEVAARAKFISAYLPLCIHQMTVEQRKRAELLVHAFNGMSVRLAKFATDLVG